MSWNSTRAKFLWRTKVCVRKPSLHLLTECQVYDVSRSCNIYFLCYFVWSYIWAWFRLRVHAFGDVSRKYSFRSLVTTSDFTLFWLSFISRQLVWVACPKIGVSFPLQRFPSVSDLQVLLYWKITSRALKSHIYDVFLSSVPQNITSLKTFVARTGVVTGWRSFYSLLRLCSFLVRRPRAPIRVSSPRFMSRARWVFYIYFFHTFQL